jgi:uncharacterized RDD family membrane protein YckC
MEEDIAENLNNDETNMILKPSPPRPWTRFWARTFDYYTFVIIVSYIWVYFDTESMDRINPTLLSLVYGLLWLFAEGLCLSVFGTTLGKKLLRIKVLNSKGEKLTPAQGFRRSFLVWWRGTGIGLSLPKLIAAILGHSRLVKEGITTWDRDMGNVVIHEKVGVFRGIFIGVMITLFIGFYLIGYFNK